MEMYNSEAIDAVRVAIPGRVTVHCSSRVALSVDYQIRIMFKSGC
jgi:hypothetical protein